MIKSILFDFDGVILDSMPVRDSGFKKIFEGYDENLVEEFIKYHNFNGGLSRYVKIKYFYEKLLGQTITENEVLLLADEFSQMMRKELVNRKYLINESEEFIKKSYQKYNLHIVSGSDGNELQYLCKELGIDRYFLSISGSPVDKNKLVENVLCNYNYKREETILIGDSINDYKAADINGINFYGYNNRDLTKYSKVYINTYIDLIL